MSKPSGTTPGKASVWIEAEINQWVARRIAECRDEQPALPQEDKPTRLLRWPEVERIAGIKRGHAHWLIRQGRFPAPLKLPAVDSDQAA